MLGKNEKGHNNDDDKKYRYQDHFSNKVTSIHVTSQLVKQLKKGLISSTLHPPTW